jgi:hypothetical protein
MNTDKKPSPLVVAGLVVAAVAAVAAIFFTATRPRTVPPSEVAATVKELQAPAGTPKVPAGMVQADVMTRGFKKNTGRKGTP